MKRIAHSACLALSFGIWSKWIGRAQTTGSADSLHITHQYTNVNARSMIGLAMGSHKTILTTDGQLKWSQLSPAQKGRAVPIGFSEQLDGALGVKMREMHGSSSRDLVASGQHLDEMHFPFIVTEWQGQPINVQETAFAVSTGSQNLDVVQMIVSNRTAETQTLELRISGKQRNLPVFASGSQLTRH